MPLLRIVSLRWCAIAVTVLIYLALYVVLRLNVVFIHRASYSDSESRIRYHHWIEPGFGTTRLRNGWTVEIAYYLFLPVEFAEAGIWHVVPREYQSRSGYTFGKAGGLRPTGPIDNP
jgi:hypothetical protein